MSGLPSAAGHKPSSSLLLPACAQEAAAIPFAALTAWEAVRRVGRAEKGQRLLVLGGGSAVGGAAVQLARAWGLEARERMRSGLCCRRVCISSEHKCAASAACLCSRKRSPAPACLNGLALSGDEQKRTQAPFFPVMKLSGD